MRDQLLTTAQVAKRLNRSQRWIQNIILRRKLPAEMVGSVYVVRLKDVEQYRHLSRGRTANGAKRAGSNGAGR